jgi:protein O-GlcNAc transferase
LGKSPFDVSSELRQAIQHHQSGELAKAEKIYERILAIDPNHPEALHLMGVIAIQAGRNDRAVSLINKAIENNPENPVYCNNLAKAYNNMGNVFRGQSKLNEAISCYQQALQLKPAYPAAYNNMGNAFQDQGKWDQAMSCYQKAVQLKQDFAEAYYNMGVVFQSQGRSSEAISFHGKALQLRPEYPEAYNNMGNAFRDEGRLNEAISCYRKALQLRPNFAEACSQLVGLLQQICAWQELKGMTVNLDDFTQKALNDGTRTVEPPFLVLTRHTDLSRIFSVAQSTSRDIGSPMSNLGLYFSFDDRRSSQTRISIGYLSNDFRDHPVGHVMLGLFNLHNRNEFEVFCYSYGKDDKSYYRKGIQQDCDKFTDLRNVSHADAARCIYEDRVDILVDLMGHTKGNRLAICALRPAPVQVSYLGYPGTTGADFLDYIITDTIVTPQDHALHYSENFVYMPHCYMVGNNAQTISQKKWKKADFGLPSDSFVFCSFNNAYKIEPVMFDVWMNILRQTPESVLWLRRANEIADKHLRQEAKRRGIFPARLRFAEKLPAKEEHLTRLELADLALDTRIYNGHMTTIDALWACVPVITLQGSHFASRSSSSILTAIGLPELISRNLGEYEALAVGLARNPLELKAIRQKLAKNRLTEPVFDTLRFVRNLEKAYKEMWKIFLSGDKSRQIEVADT